MNTVILIGYLGSDAETRTARNNSTLTVLSLATNRNRKDRETGERQSQTTWHRCVSFRQTATYAATLTKGAHVQIVGEFQTCEYVAKDGAKSATEVRVRRLTHLTKPRRPHLNPRGPPHKRPLQRVWSDLRKFLALPESTLAMYISSGVRHSD